MRCNRVNGFLSLGVILYLSTFPLGKAQTNCTALGNQCGSSQPDCCEGLTCFTENSTTSTCQNCTAENDTCTTDDDAKSCCGTMLCFGGQCKPCTVQDDVCGRDQPDCCEVLTSFAENSTTS
eukprot:75560_1